MQSVGHKAVFVCIEIQDALLISLRIKLQYRLFKTDTPLGPLGKGTADPKLGLIGKLVGNSFRYRRQTLCCIQRALDPENAGQTGAFHIY